MAIIHRTTVKPTKLELLTSWLPSRPWYRGGADGPRLQKAGGFRLDDPQGEVGIEFMVVTDAYGDEPAAYLVPLTYRAAPLDGAEHALVGTMEHGVLGPRWAYDGCHDPVMAQQLLALIEGRAEPQAQSINDTVDREVTRSFTGEGPAGPHINGPGATPADDRECTEVPLPDGRFLRLQRVLRSAPGTKPEPPQGVAGHVAGPWQMPDGTRAEGLFAVLHGEPRA